MTTPAARRTRPALFADFSIRAMLTCWSVGVMCTKVQSQASTLPPKLLVAARTNIVSGQSFACCFSQSVSKRSNCCRRQLLRTDARVLSRKLRCIDAQPCPHEQLANVQSTGQGCETCPVDIIGESCLSCKGGQSLVSPGESRHLSLSQQKNLFCGRDEWLVPQDSWCLELRLTAGVVLPSCL